MTTRRQWRKQRPRLRIGDTRVEGKVVKWCDRKFCGFIRPANGAAHIFFHGNDVPFEREKCVGVGRTVFFTVTPGGSRKFKAIIT
jgi:cold shock CspA family protein